MSDDLALEVPGTLVEAIARRAADLILAETREPRWRTLDEAAEHLRTTPGALRWRAQNNRLPGAVKDGGRWLVDLNVLDEALAEAGSLGASHKRGSHRVNGRAPGTGGTSSHAR